MSDVNHQAADHRAAARIRPSAGALRIRSAPHQETCHVR
jgi:hypothetical protein